LVLGLLLELDELELDEPLSPLVEVLLVLSEDDEEPEVPEVPEELGALDDELGPLTLALDARESLMYQPLPLNTMPTG
jgi:hypothetical protein